MKIEPKSIKVRDIFESYSDNGDDGVFAYGGKLAIRPAYQREFVYSTEQAEAVMHTILKGFPLNVMYWVKIGNEKYEVLDGQQRTISVMQYLKHQFPITIDGKKYYWDALPDDKYNSIMNYEFMIYICEGNESEKLDWFKVVNIAGEKLTEQELRNSVYTGEWLSDAKKYFSKRNCAAKGLSDKYITGDPNRQELLEKALKGISEFQGIKDITEYMAAHKSDNDADELWQYFQDVISWVQKIFPKYYPDMKGLDWCHFYNEYHSNLYNSSMMNAEVKRLHEDEDVQNQKEFMNIFCAKTKTLLPEDCLIYEHLIREIKWLLIANKMAFALFASNILSLKKWRVIILSLGAKVVIQLQITVKCCVEIAMERKRISTKKSNYPLQLLDF